MPTQAKVDSAGCWGMGGQPHTYIHTHTLSLSHTHTRALTSKARVTIQTDFRCGTTECEGECLLVASFAALNRRQLLQKCRQLAERWIFVCAAAVKQRGGKLAQAINLGSELRLQPLGDWLK